MPNTTFDRPDLSTFTHLDDLGLEVTGQRMWPDHAVLACRIVSEDRWCRRCGCQGEARDTVVRRLAHEPYGWRPTILHVSVRRYRCQECAHVWRQDMSQAADPRAKLSRAAVRWALTGLVVHHLTVARIAQALGVSWNTANTAVLAEGERSLINDPTRFEGVRVIGVDEHVWRHTPYGDKYVTVILDLTPIRDRRGPSRLLDMVPGRSKKVFKTWLASQPDTWRERIEIVAMDGFTGFKSAAAEELPGATTVMDPFHVVHLAGNALDECRRRIQQELHHRRGRATDPLYKARRMLHTRSCLLTARQQHQILDLFSNDEHVALEVTWSAYQNIIDAYRSSNARGGKTLMHEEITRLTSTGMPSSLTELTTLGRTLKRRATDILAYFDNPHTTGGPTEAINGRLEHLHGSTPGLAKPHQLHHPSTPRNRRIQTPTTPPIMKSPITPDLTRPLRDTNGMSSLREVQTISKSTHILPMPSLTRLPTGGVLNPLKNTTNTSHNELLHQDPLQPPLEPRPRPLPGHDTPNPARHPHTLNYEGSSYSVSALWLRGGREPSISMGILSSVPSGCLA